MIHSGRTIELGDNRRQLDAEPPLVAAAAGGLDLRAPPVAPAHDETGNRLDDEQAIAAAGALDEPFHQRVARRRPFRSANAATIDAGPLGSAAVAMSARRVTRRQVKCPICFGRFRHGPGMAVKPDHFGGVELAIPTPRRLHRAASEIDEQHAFVPPVNGFGHSRFGQRAHDFAHEQKVERRVEQRERRSLACTVERAALADPLPSFDIRRRKRAQCRRHLRECQVRKMTRFEGVEPVIESGVVAHSRAAGIPTGSAIVRGISGIQLALILTPDADYVFEAPKEAPKCRRPDRWPRSFLQC